MIAIHVGLAVATLIIGCTIWLGRRQDERAQHAFDSGRATTFNKKFDEFEKRIDRA